MRVCLCVTCVCDCVSVLGGLMVVECERVRGTIYLTEILKLHLSEILLMQALRLRKKKTSWKVTGKERVRDVKKKMYLILLLSY